MDETADVLLAYKMNGKELSPDHGYPIRLIVPGYIGGRMVRREERDPRPVVFTAAVLFYSAIIWLAEKLPSIELFNQG